MRALTLTTTETAASGTIARFGVIVLYCCNGCDIDINVQTYAKIHSPL